VVSGGSLVDTEASMIRRVTVVERGFVPAGEVAGTGVSPLHGAGSVPARAIGLWEAK